MGHYGIRYVQETCPKTKRLRIEEEDDEDKEERERQAKNFAILAHTKSWMK